MGLFSRKKQSSPKEAPESGRSKQFIKIIDVISEGEIEGFITDSETDEEKCNESIFLDNTPLKQGNSFSFKNVEWQAVGGQQNQEQLDGFNEVEKEIAVNTELTRKTGALTKTITDSNVRKIRLTVGVYSLSETNNNGDINTAKVELSYAIYAMKRLKANPNAREFRAKIDGEVIAFDGKYSSQFLKSITIDLNSKDEIYEYSPPLTIEVTRKTADSTSARLQNRTFWSSYTEITPESFTYPNTAVLGLKFDSDYFSSIPSRTYDIKGIRVQIPSNYNPITRRYTRVWNGEFKTDWTNNPAWILYDLITNKRYGLGARLGAFSVDKWKLYEIAQYCDQLVDNGQGGKEPRFTCNVWLTEQRKAYDVINDICSIFRAIPVWNGQQLTFIQDRPTSPVFTYTQANIIGSIERSYSALKARHNAVQVEYLNKNNAYSKEIEYISDDESIRKNGLNLTKVQAFGCTSRGQAYRTGKWILETEKREIETVKFSVGAEGLACIPGDIIKLVDNYHIGADFGGRIKAINSTGRIITLDRPLRGNIKANDMFCYTHNQTGVFTKVKITEINTANNTITSQYGVYANINDVWTVQSSAIKETLYRVLNIAENKDGTYTITAFQHDPSKEQAVDTGRNFADITASTLHTEKAVGFSVVYRDNKAFLTWEKITGGIHYTINIIDSQDKSIINAFYITSTEREISSLNAGSYTAEIIVRNTANVIIAKDSIKFDIGEIPTPKNVQAVGGLSDIKLTWDNPEGYSTEIWQSTTNNLETTTKLDTVQGFYFSHSLNANQRCFYWLRFIQGDKKGAFSQVVQATTGKTAEIAQEVALIANEIKEIIADNTLTQSMQAKGLEFIKLVNGLNVREFQGVNLVFDESNKKLYRWNGSLYTAQTETADLAGQIQNNQIANYAINAAKIGSQAVIAGKLANSAVTAVKIANGSVITAKLADNAVTSAKIADNSINASKLQANSITSEQIQEGAVQAKHINNKTITSEQIADRAIVNALIGASAVSGGKIANNAITAPKIANNAVTAEKISVNSLSDISSNLGTIQSGTIYNSVIEESVLNFCTLNNSSGIHSGQLATGVLSSSDLIDTQAKEMRKTSKTATETYLENGVEKTRRVHIWESTITIKPSQIARRLIMSNKFPPFILERGKSWVQTIEENGTGGLNLPPATGSLIWVNMFVLSSGSKITIN